MQTTTYKGTDKVLIGFILAVLTFWLFANSMMNVSPVMTDKLGMNANTMNIAVSLAALFSGIFIVVFGGLADSVGRTKIFKIGLYLAIIGSLLVGLSPKGSLAVPMLLIGRALQGLSAACVMPTSLGMIKIFWEGKERQRAISLWSIGTFGGSGLSSLTGGIIASSLGWRWIFFFAVIVAIIALYLTKELPENKRETAGKYKVDWSGIFAFMVAMIGLQLLISKGSDFGWTSSIGRDIIIVTLTFGFLFFVIESGKKEAFFDFKLFKNKIFTGATLANFFINGTAGLLIVSLTLMQRGAQFSAMKAGLLTLGFAIAVILFIRVGEKLLQRYGAKKPIIWGALIICAAILLLMQTQIMTGQYVVLAVIAYSLFGLGLAFFATPATDAALSNLPESQAGSGAGIFKMASSLGTSFGVAIAAGIYTAVVSRTEPIAWLGKLIGFVGRQDNLLVRQGAMLGLGFCLLLAILVIVSVVTTIPDKKKVEKE
ncbi:MAG TPA: MFS transporter [Bacteroidales bacterium]|nr:MFS transporter [Bacteroidales bacterium]HPZ03364.1 MFS transporter [Bacteroidales bacterium]HQB75716.1 MFS transporter [Bacteroidales bacterium]